MSGIRALSPTRARSTKTADAAASEPTRLMHHHRIPVENPQPPPKPQPIVNNSGDYVQSKRSLGGLANLAKVRAPKFDNELSSSSGGIPQQSTVQRQPVLSSSDESLPQPPTALRGRKSRRQPLSPPPSESSSMGGDVGTDSSDEVGDDLRMPRPVFQEDPVEKEIQKAIRTAKLLARIDQLAARGIAKSKSTYNHRSSEDELIVEVARMEVLAQRSVRIQQGRSVFITCVGGMEKGMNLCDTNNVMPFGLKWQMQDFTKATVKDITNYDDCLERGVEAMLGPTSNMPWYIELLMILIPSMVTHSMLNRFKDPEHTNAVLNQNPQLRAQVAQNIARERSLNQTLPSQQPQRVQMQPPPPQNNSRVQMQPPPARTSALNNREEPPLPSPAAVRQTQADMQRSEQLLRQQRQIEDQNVRLDMMQRQMEQQLQQLQQAQAQAARNPRVINEDNNHISGGGGDDDSESIDIVIE